MIADARDMLGGSGVLLANRVIRHMGDVEVIHTFEGTETMQALIVGRDITTVGAFAWTMPARRPGGWRYDRWRHGHLGVSRMGRRPRRRRAARGAGARR